MSAKELAKAVVEGLHKVHNDMTPSRLERCDIDGHAMRIDAAIKYINASRTPPAPVEAVAWREAAEKARTFARCYPHASDGRNTFIMFAEWAESKALAAHPSQPDALPGDLRERVARRMFDADSKECGLSRDWMFEGGCHASYFAMADAAISLIQSERGSL